jgi:hypothetical protein
VRGMRIESQCLRQVHHVQQRGAVAAAAVDPGMTIAPTTEIMLLLLQQTYRMKSAVFIAGSQRTPEQL